MQECNPRGNRKRSQHGTIARICDRFLMCAISSKTHSLAHVRSETMVTTAGTSVLGQQVIGSSTVAPLKLLSIAIRSQPLPPVRRLGYWWLFQYKNLSPFQCYVVEEGILRAPGTFVPIRLAPFADDWYFRLDAEWNVPGIEWTTVIT